MQRGILLKELDIHFQIYVKVLGSMPFPFQKNIKRARIMPRSSFSHGDLPSCPCIEFNVSGRGTPPCEHLETEYQPSEPENNAPESLSCADCGADLPLEEENI